MEQLLQDSIDLLNAGGSADLFPTRFWDLVKAELIRGKLKFPDNAGNHTAMIEEVGEVAKALMYEPWAHVVAECVQVAAMVLRVAWEGDRLMLEFRAGNGLASPGVYDSCSTCGSVVSQVVTSASLPAVIAACSACGSPDVVDVALWRKVEDARAVITAQLKRNSGIVCTHLNDCVCDEHVLEQVLAMLPSRVTAGK